MWRTCPCPRAPEFRRYPAYEPTRLVGAIKAYPSARVARVYSPCPRSFDGSICRFRWVARSFSRNRRARPIRAHAGRIEPLLCSRSKRKATVLPTAILRSEWNLFPFHEAEQRKDHEHLLRHCLPFVSLCCLRDGQYLTVNSEVEYIIARVPLEELRPSGRRLPCSYRSMKESPNSARDLSL